MKLRAYLDIETTGLSPSYADLTVIGIAFEAPRGCRVVQFVGDGITPVNLMETLSCADEIYTYNGSRFDLPFIKAKLRVDIRQEFVHTDLMYSCWQKDLKGGLKAVERKLAITRKLQDVNGYIAVQLWWDYVNNNNKHALDVLLAYNREDAVNLRQLRRKLGVG